MSLYDWDAIDQKPSGNMPALMKEEEIVILNLN